MSTDNETMENLKKHARSIGAIAGAVVFVLLLLIGAGFLFALAIGVILAFGMPLLAGKPEERDTTEASGADIPEAAEPVTEPQADVPAETAPDAETAPVAETPIASDPEIVSTQSESADDSNDDAELVKPSAVLPGEQELAARKGSWRYQPS